MTIRGCNEKHVSSCTHRVGAHACEHYVGVYAHLIIRCCKDKHATPCVHFVLHAYTTLLGEVCTHNIMCMLDHGMYV
jgi:hypothetical protein